MIDDFEWDEDKRLANLRNRGVDFREAALIFVNPVIEGEDDREDHGEVRIRALGHVGDDYSWSPTHGVPTAAGSLPHGRSESMENDDTKRYSKDELVEMRNSGEYMPVRPDAVTIELDASFWERAKVVMPSAKSSVHLRVDSDVLDWFRAQGKGHLTRINAVLRSYVDAQKSSPR